MIEQDFIVVCCVCKNTKLSEKEWIPLLQEYPGKKVSHGMCPPCFEEYMLDLKESYDIKEAI